MIENRWLREQLFVTLKLWRQIISSNDPTCKKISSCHSGNQMSFWKLWGRMIQPVLLSKLPANCNNLLRSNFKRKKLLSNGPASYDPRNLFCECIEYLTLMYVKLINIFRRNGFDPVDVHLANVSGPWIAPTVTAAVSSQPPGVMNVFLHRSNQISCKQTGNMSWRSPLHLTSKTYLGHYFQETHVPSVQPESTGI